ncbi:MAG: HD-GYP domain-containing protein [Arcobacter sp.]|uniref:HD-GYP domain-containing protein n=1 Tax=Arcobacter sp. TaxID=1872629 RepID=UPI003AFF9E63
MDNSNYLVNEDKYHNYEKAKLIKISPKIFLENKDFDYLIYEEDTDGLFKKFLDFKNECDRTKINSVEKNNIQDLYIKHEDFDKYSKDISKYISNILNNKDNSLLIKSESIHELANDTMYELLTGEITKNKINHVSEIVNSSVEFILNDPNAMQSMIEVTTHDYYTYTHSVDVSTYALAFGAYLGLNENQLRFLGKGAMLHDIGKKKVPLEIINKNGKLTKEEFSIMKKHPSYGVDILESLGENDNNLLAIVEEHHEKFDGSGYPKGLKGNEIHPFSQIVAICDIFNALTTKRSYKEPMSSFDAIKIMYELMRNELNLKLLSQFIQFLKK